MVDWLKFFFLSFFMDKYAKEAAERRMLNALLGILLALVLLFAGLMIGYVSSFGRHYDNASEFRKFAYSVFSVTGDNGVEFSVKKENMTASAVVDTFKSDEGAHGKYALIIDTRPAATTYDDFSAFCTDKSGQKIDYSAWLELDEEQRKSYKFDIEYSGTALDVAAHKDEYTAFFDSDRASDAAKADLSALDERLASDKLTEAEYNNALYELYVKNYYPSLSSREKFGNAPTLRTYYRETINKQKPEEYLIVFEDRLSATFVTDKGVPVQIDGTFADANGIAVNKNMPEWQAKSNVDKLMHAVFDSATGMSVSVYFINIFTSLPWTLIAFVLCAAACAVTVKFTRTEKSIAYGGTRSIGIGGACKIVGMFMLGAGVITFVAAAVMSQFISRSAAFSYSLLCLTVVMAARTVAFCIAECVRAHRKKKNAPTDENEDGPQSEELISNS